MSNLGRQFKTRVTKSKVYDEDDNPTVMPITNISLHVGGKSVAKVKLAKIDDDSHVEWLETKKEHQGKGYAKDLMHEVYRRTKGTVNWSKTMHPASEHLARQFDKIYPGRTEYQSSQEAYPQISRYRQGLK